MADKLDDRQHLLSYVAGAWVSSSLWVLARYKVADLLASGPKAAEEIASLTEPKLNPEALHRLLRFLANFGFLEADENGEKFGLKSITKLLVSNIPGSMRDIVLLTGHPGNTPAWSNLHRTIETGEPRALDVYKTSSYFEYLDKNPDLESTYSTCMTAHTKIQIPAILKAYDFAVFNTIVDVGGNSGSLLAEILQKFPTVKKGIVLDLPGVVENYKVADNLGGRLEWVPGDMFSSVVPGGDAYILKTVLHNWSDEKSVELLRVVAGVLKPHAKALIIENKMTPEFKAFEMGKLLDLQMMHSYGGKVRTQKELEEIFAKSGLRLETIVPTASPVWIVVASKLLVEQ